MDAAGARTLDRVPVLVGEMIGPGFARIKVKKQVSPETSPKVAAVSVWSPVATVAVPTDDSQPKPRWAIRGTTDL